MATRQYVGARYVPKFATPVEWSASRQYEALEIVTHMNASYTSKKPVPTGVDINNTEYWTITGNYNAQVEQYRQETEQVASQVDTLSTSVSNLSNSVSSLNASIGVINNSLTDVQNDVANVQSEIGIPYSLKNKKVVLFGDSLNRSGWGAQLNAILGCNGDIVYNGSAGFVRAGTESPYAGKNFGQMLAQYAEGISEAVRATYAAFIIAGGINDYEQSTSNVRTAATQFVSSVKNYFPNAKIYYFPNPTFTPYVQSVWDNLKAICESFEEGGCATYFDFAYVCYDNPTWDSGDGVHLNPGGYKKYAGCMASGICGGSVSSPSVAAISPSSKITIIQQAGSCRDGVVDITCVGTLNVDMTGATHNCFEITVDGVSIPLSFNTSGGGYNLTPSGAYGSATGTVAIVAVNRIGSIYVPSGTLSAGAAIYLEFHFKYCVALPSA